MNIKEIQSYILENTGLKTSVKRFSKGSQKGYVRIMPIFQNGAYQSFPHEFITSFRSVIDIHYPPTEETPNFCTVSDILIFTNDDSKIVMKKEKKPKKISEMKGGKGWGSKNSQLRLDKAVKRYGKRIRGGNDCARYN